MTFVADLTVCRHNFFMSAVTCGPFTPWLCRSHSAFARHAPVSFARHAAVLSTHKGQRSYSASITAVLFLLVAYADVK